MGSNPNKSLFSCFCCVLLFLLFVVVVVVVVVVVLHGQDHSVIRGGVVLWLLIF